MKSFIFYASLLFFLPVALCAPGNDTRAAVDLIPGFRAASINGTEHIVPSKDGRCGLQPNGEIWGCVGSPTGNCCSRFGWCGNHAGYCTPDEGCQQILGMCKHPEHKCGAQDDGNVYSCVQGSGQKCCSIWGYCGGSSEYCENPKCVGKFGKCG